MSISIAVTTSNSVHRGQSICLGVNLRFITTKTGASPPAAIKADSGDYLPP